MFEKIRTLIRMIAASRRLPDRYTVTERDLRLQCLGDSEADKRYIAMERALLNSMAEQDPLLNQMINSRELVIERLTKNPDESVRHLANRVRSIFHEDMLVETLIPLYESVMRNDPASSLRMIALSRLSIYSEIIRLDGDRKSRIAKFAAMICNSIDRTDEERIQAYSLLCALCGLNSKAARVMVTDFKPSQFDQAFIEANMK